jgi:hypothetical protein
MPKAAGMETRNGGEAEKKKMETLIRAVAAANEGKEYTQKDDKWHVMFDELKRYKEEVSVSTCFGACGLAVVI